MRLRAQATQDPQRALYIEDSGSAHRSVHQLEHCSVETSWKLDGTQLLVAWPTCEQNVQPSHAHFEDALQCCAEKLASHQPSQYTACDGLALQLCSFPSGPPQCPQSWQRQSSHESSLHQR